MSLSKDKVTKVSLWVKIHKVPVLAYSEDGLSIIATQIGKPIMLDAFTTTMCAEPWGRLGFARALIEVTTEKELKSQVTMAVPMVNGEGHSMAKMDVVYEWKPSMCDECLVFGHANEQCPRRVIDTPKENVVVQNDGFTTVVNRKNKGKVNASQKKPTGGFKVSNTKLVYQPVKPKENASKPSTSDSKRKEQELEENGENNNGIKLRNLLDKLNDISYQVNPNSDIGDVGITSDTTKPDEDSDSEVEEVFRNWDWISNASLCDKGCRIILGWKKDLVDVLLLTQTSQAVHTKVLHKVNNKVLYCSFIYAGNKTIERRTLWADLDLHKYVVQDFPWVLICDFNVALNIEDSCLGSTKMNSAMCNFKDCVKKIEVIDINSFGLHYTWNQKPKGSNGVLKKLDHSMGNIGFVDNFPGAYAIFQPYRISDHSPAVLKLPSLSVEGHAMFQVTQKMKNLKKPLRKLFHDQGNLHERVNRLRVELDVVQKALDSDLSNSLLRDEEAVYIQAFNDAKIDEERFLRQKAKIDWLDVGDSNSAYFYKSMKSKSQRNRIEVITNSANVVVTGNEVPKVFVAHYESFLGTNMDCTDLDTTGLFVKHVSEFSIANMVRQVSNDEIKKVMFDIRDGKSPGPDGYTLAFFKKGRDVVGSDVCRAVRDFFDNGKLLKEVNHTFLALIPKVTTPKCVNDFRPISCCNVLFKCISKILTNHIIEGIKDVVSENQSIFVLGDLDSAKVIMGSFDEFKLVSGLVPSIPKSTVFLLFLIDFLIGIAKSLLKRLVTELEIERTSLFLLQLIRGFLWCNEDYKRGKAKVAWDDICLPIRKGGLGLRCLEVGNGLNTSLWFDRWCIQGPLIRFLSPRDIAREGYTLKTCVADLIVNGAWNWPISWLAKAPTISSIDVPLLRDHVDKVCWRSSNGSMSIFSVKLAWEALRPRGAEVGWCLVVWFSHFVPRHTFNLWLIMRRYLKTQDNLRPWDVGENVIISSLRCSLCNLVMDSHERLFFKCVYSSKVWRFICTLAGMESVSPRLEDIVDWLHPMAAKRTFKSIVGKLILAATAYFIWSERNNRLFKNVRRSPEELNDLIMVVVHLKLTTFWLFSSFITTAKGGTSLIFTLFSLQAGAKLNFEAEELLLSLARAENAGRILPVPRFGKIKPSASDNQGLSTPVSFSSASAMSTLTLTISLSSDDTSSLSHSLASAIRPLFFTLKALEAEAFKLRSARLALTLLYLALKSLPLDNKPPNPILEEFSTLSGMSIEGLSHKLFVPSGVKVASRSRGRPKGLKNCSTNVKIKVQSSSNCLPAADDGHGKRPNTCSIPVDEVIDKVSCCKGETDNYCSVKGGLFGVADPCLVSNDTSKSNMADDGNVGVEVLGKLTRMGWIGWKEPDIWLENVEPSSIPIWVRVWYSMELCSGNRIGKIFSGIVEVFAIDDLHCPLEIEYPQIGDKPARIGPEDKIVAMKVRGAEKSKVDSTVIGNPGVSKDDEFVTVGKRNRPLGPNYQSKGGGQKFVAVGIKNKVVNNSIGVRKGKIGDSLIRKQCFDNKTSFTKVVQIMVWSPMWMMMMMMSLRMRVVDVMKPENLGEYCPDVANDETSSKSINDES
uniref:Reverse transcriptase zinc-binding domain-containing protein n=1 Tax=Tanacetum cinerariifolium TaxID=118510 RepID=A0A6L2NY10_TANCI|nr:hypothetical protein [Tanacetum cinerariifolium]